ncbi:flagellar assembly protein FliH [Vreelandella sp.]|uniref:flagellar assembly protein FliH n=1 Tax=Vreelandella sp. TaxID=3137778 RepID=UPI003BA84FF5
MSSPEFDRHGDWRRWQMDELTTANRTTQAHRAPAPTEHQRKVEAAQRAAEEARAREEQERQEMYERIRKAAEEEGYQAGLTRGQEEGYAQGLSEGREHAAQELNAQIRQSVTPLAALAKQFSDALERIDETIAHDLVELALATGKQLAGDALDAHPDHILTIVRELLHTEPPLVGKQRLWLNPTDHEKVAEHLGSELEAANWTLQPDDQLARGGCRLTSAQGELDATFESRWQSVQAQFRKRHSVPSSG